MRRVLFASLLLIGPPSLAAEPVTLYEAIDDVDLGRVFMTPGERARLEARRGIVIAEGVGDANADPAGEPPPAAKPAAGIIVSSKGRALIWREGGFRRADTVGVDDVRFPGAVRIERFIAPTDEPAADDSSSAEPDGQSDATHDE